MPILNSLFVIFHRFILTIYIIVVELMLELWDVNLVLFHLFLLINLKFKDLIYVNILIWVYDIYLKM